MDVTKQALVLKIVDRFYSMHTGDRITTAWTLAGAFLFLEGAAVKIENVEELLKKKGYNPIRKIVEVLD